MEWLDSPTVMMTAAGVLIGALAKLVGSSASLLAAIGTFKKDPSFSILIQER